MRVCLYVVRADNGRMKCDIYLLWFKNSGFNFHIHVDLYAYRAKFNASHIMIRATTPSCVPFLFPLLSLMEIPPTLNE